MGVTPLTGTTVLTGTSAKHDMQGNVTITAPGLSGVAELTHGVPLDTAGAKVFEHSLGNSGMTRSWSVLVTHNSAPDQDVKITVPAPGAGSNALLLVHDATGAVSWHRPDELPPAAAGFAAGAAGAAADAAPPSAAAPETISFTVPGTRFTVSSAPAGLLERAAEFLRHFDFHPGTSGLNKVLSVIEYPVEHLIGMAPETWFSRWETNKHPSVVRWFPPTGNLKVGEPLSPTNWGELAEGRAVLFIHGIFSSCESAFSGLSTADDKVWTALRENYSSRIIAFDHPTATVSPADNAQWLLDQLDQLPGVALDVDIVCHSRGGLVARSLAQAQPKPGGGRMNVKKIVFAATPNGGTQIADSTTWGNVVNRLTSVLTLPTAALPGPVEVVSEILAALLEITKIVGTGAALKLPGLADMKQGSAYLQGLSQPAGAQVPTYYAAAADFEPGALLTHLFHKLDDEAELVDRDIFPHVRNDIAVPTNGVWDPANPDGANPPPDGQEIPGFPVPEERRLPLGPGDTYWHCSYFGDEQLRTALIDWLTKDQDHLEANRLLSKGTVAKLSGTARHPPRSPWPGYSPSEPGSGPSLMTGQGDADRCVDGPAGDLPSLTFTTIASMTRGLVARGPCTATTSVSHQWTAVPNRCPTP
jgi:hypothetical protein